MKISILTIGDELLKGAIINTNAAFLGEMLLSRGWIPTMCVTVPDKLDDIARTMDFLLSHSDIVITSGGLGPTGDDVTCQAIAEYFKTPLTADEKTSKKLRQYLENGQTKCPPERLLRQAMIPQGAEAWDNPVGTAPGIWFKPQNVNKYICMLPGPPPEQRPMIVNCLLPHLSQMMKERSYSRLFRIACAAEAWIEEITTKILSDAPGIAPAYCATADQVRLFLSGSDEAILDAKAEEVKKFFGNRIIRSDCQSLAEEMVAVLRERGNMQLATAESCTGGMIAAAITDIPGSSAVFRGSIIAYSDEIKRDVLGVSSTVLSAYGSVSGQCVSSMVENLCVKLHTEAGIAVSGIAGPGGGTPEKPVGLVFVAVKLGQRVVVRQFNFPGNRDAVRRSTVAAALFELRSLLLDQ